MKNYLFFTAALLAAAMLTQGCKKDNIVNLKGSTVGFVSFEDDPVSALGGERGPISVLSYQDWIIASDDGPHWLSGTPSSGSGNGEFMAVVGFNYGAERTGIVTVHAASGQNPYSAGKVTITQRPVTDVTIILLNETFTSGNSAGQNPTIASYANAGYLKEGLGVGVISYTGVASPSNSNNEPRIRNATGVTPSYSYVSAANSIFLPDGSAFIINQLNTGFAPHMILSFGCARGNAEYVSGVTTPNVTADDPEPFDYDYLDVEWAESASGPWNKIEYRRENWWKSKIGWDMAVSDIVRETPGEYIWIRFTAHAPTAVLIDDIFVRSLKMDPVEYAPIVTTDEVADTDIQTYTATVKASYVYPTGASYPSVTGYGARYKLRDVANAQWSNNIAGVISTAPNFSTTFPVLEEEVWYIAQAYATVPAGTFYGNEVEFKTKPFDEGVPRTAMSEDFNAITEQGVSFRSNGWRTKVDDGAIDEGWLTDVTGAAPETDTRLISTTTKTSYAILPPLNIAGAKTIPSLFFNYGATTAGSVLLISLSTDLNSWTQVASLPIATANTWSMATIDFATIASGAYASGTKLYVALIASTPGVYFDEVIYGEGHPVTYGTPEITAGNLAQGEAGSLTLTIPYKYGNGSSNFPTVTATGYTVTPDQINLTAGNIESQNLTYTIAGTPGANDNFITINIVYPTDSEYGTVTSIKQAIADASGYYTFLNFTFTPNVANTNFVGAGPLGAVTSIDFSDTYGDPLFTVTRYYYADINPADFVWSASQGGGGIQFGRNRVADQGLTHILYSIYLPQTISGSLSASVPIHFNNANNGGGYDLEYSTTDDGPWTFVASANNPANSSGNNLQFVGDVTLPTPILRTLYLRITKGTAANTTNTSQTYLVKDQNITLKFKP